MRQGMIWTAILCGLFLSSAWPQAAAAAEPDKKAALVPIVPVDPKLGRPVDFERDVFPMIEANCIACHNLAVKENNLNLEDLENILKGGKNGRSIVPRDPDKSLLYRVAAHLQAPAMPPPGNKVEANKFTPKELGILRQWILEGAGGGSAGTGPDIPWQAPSLNSQAIYSTAVTADGQFAACGRANQIAIYHLPTDSGPTYLVDPNLAALKNGEKPLYTASPAHRDLIHALAFSPDGSTLASGDYRSVKLWKRPLNAVRREFAAASAIKAVAVSADGKWLATGSVDHQIRLWNLADGKPGPVLKGHTAAITAVSFSPDQGKLYSAAADKTVRIWSVATGESLAQATTDQIVQGLAVNPKGDLVATAQAGGLVQLWQISGTDKPTFVAGKVLKGHAQTVNSVAFLAPAGELIVTGSEDGTARIWKTADGSQVRAVTHGAPIGAIAAKPDGSQVTTAGANFVRLWQVADGKQLAELKGDIRADRLVVKLTADERDAVAAIAAAEAAFKSAETELKAKEESVKKATEALAAAEKAAKEAQDKVKPAMDKADAAKKAFEAKKDDKALEKAKVDADKVVTDAQAAVKTAADGLASAKRGLDAAKKTAEIGKALVESEKKAVEQAKVTRTNVAAQVKASQEAAAKAQQPIRSVAWSRDGKFLATAGDDQLIHTWRADGSGVEILSGHKAPVTGLAFANGLDLISVSTDQTARDWNLSPEWKLAGQIGPKPDAPLDLKQSPFVDRVVALAFSPDGKLLATGGGDPSRSGQLMLWDVEKLTLVRDFKDAHSDVVMGIDFSLDGKKMASCGADKFVRVFDPATGKQIKSFEGHTNHVLDVAFKGDGVILGSSGADNAIKIWSLETGEQVRTIALFAKQATALQFVGRTSTIIGSGGDATVRLINSDNGAQVRAFGGAGDYMYSVAATEDEKQVIAGGEDGVLRVWNLADAKSLANFAPPKPPTQVAAGKK